MARLPLNTLPAFRAAATLQNLRAAADELHLTHSAVSQQIRTLEEQLGFALFERRGRRIVLNSAGAALLRSVEPALALLDDGAQAAAAAASGTDQRLRVTVLPSFAQRWLLPRMGRWRERHPDIALEVEASQRLVDLQREGFHAALRSGRNGQWPGLEAESLIESPLIAVGSPQAARRLYGRGVAALADEALIGGSSDWDQWFAAAGVRVRTRSMAEFNDSGLMLQAAEHDMGLALARELLAADALADGRLVRLSPVTLEPPDGARSYFLAYPPALRDWPPLAALRAWLVDELGDAQRQLDALRALPMGQPATAKKAPAGRSESRSRAASAKRAPDRGR
jgi:LysR family glycine cleavage system transcriptional activator